MPGNNGNRRGRKGTGGANRKTKSKKRLGKMSQVRLDQQGGRGGMGSPMAGAVSLSRRVQSMQPRIVRGVNSMRIAHRELVVASVPGSSTFTVQNIISLNPGLASFLAWLAPQAQQWQQYTVHGLRFIWVPIAPTSTAGDVYLVPDYDASDPQPTTEIQAADNVDAVVDSVWQDIACDLDRFGMMGLGPRRFVRPCAMAGDIKTFDVGKFFLCTNNGTTAAAGKLFCEYDIEFFSPQNDPNPDTTPMQTSYFTQAVSQTVTTATPTVVLWDTLIYDPLAVATTGFSSGTFTPPAGCYRVYCGLSGHDSASETFTVAIELQKNGASITPHKCEIQSKSAATGATEDVAASCEAVIPMNGTDTFAAVVTLTGAAGTLSVNGTFAQLLFSLA